MLGTRDITKAFPFPTSQQNDDGASHDFRIFHNNRDRHHHHTKSQQAQQARTKLDWILTISIFALPTANYQLFKQQEIQKGQY